MIADRWGATDAEVARPYPCDEFAANPALEAWRAVGVRTTRDRVWPWVRQIRIAPYSYDWIDNLGRPSPRTLRPLPDPEVGDPYSTAFRGREVGRIRSVEPGVHLTGQIMGAFMSYVLVPDGESTRLLLKIVMPGHRLLAPMVSLGDLVMARKQLLNLKRLAETS